MERAARMTPTAVDGQLIEACRCGDRDAYRELFETYKDRVYSIALHFTANEAAAHDITQQVFIKLLTRINRFDGSSAFSTWLYRVVVNTCIDEKRKVKRLTFVGGDDESPLPEVTDPAPSSEDRLVRSSDDRTVHDAVNGLAPKLRMAVLLRYYEDLTYDEMADVLGVSKGTVASRLNRGHQQLARRLAHLKSAMKGGGGTC